MAQFRVFHNDQQTLATSAAVYRHPSSGSSTVGASSVETEVKSSYDHVDLLVNCNSNAIGTDTVVDLDGGSNVVATVPASTSGDFSDTTNTESLSSGNGTYLRVHNASYSSGSQVLFYSHTYEHASSGAPHFAGLGSTISSGTHRYIAIEGLMTSANTTRAAACFVAKATHEVSKLHVRVTSHSVTGGNPTLAINITGTDGAVTVTLTGTGEFEDVSNTQAIASGDEVCLHTVRVGSSGSYNANRMMTQFTDQYRYNGRGAAGYLAVSSALPSPVNTGAIGSTEAVYNNDVLTAERISYQAVYVSANTSGVNGAEELRFNASTTAISTTIPSSTTGYFVETTTTYTPATTDDVNDRLVENGSGSITIAGLWRMWPGVDIVAAADPPQDDVFLAGVVADRLPFELYAVLEVFTPAEILAGLRTLDPLVDLTSITPHVDDEEGPAFLVGQQEQQRWPSFPRELEPATRQGYIDIMSWANVIASVLVDLTSQPPHPEDDGSGLIARAFRPNAEFPPKLIPATQQGYLTVMSSLRTIASVLIDLTSITPPLEDEGSTDTALRLKWQETPPFPPELMATLDVLINLPAVPGQGSISTVLADLTSQPPDIEDQGLAFLHRPVEPEELAQDLRPATEQGWAPLASQVSNSTTVTSDLTSIPAGDDPEAIRRAYELERTRWVHFPVTAIPQLDTFIPPQPVTDTRMISGVEIDLTSVLPETGEHDVWDVVQREAKLADGRRMLQLDVMKATEHQFNPPSGAATPISPTLTISAVQIDLEHWAVSAEGETFVADLGVITWTAEEDDLVAGITFIKDSDSNP